MVGELTPITASGPYIIPQAKPISSGHKVSGCRLKCSVSHKQNLVTSRRNRQSYYCPRVIVPSFFLSVGADRRLFFKTNREDLIYSPQWSSWGDRIELVTTSWTTDAPWAFWEIVAMYEQKIDSLSQRVPDKPRPSDMCLREGSCWQPQLAAVVSRFLHEEREMIWKPSIAIHDI